MKRNDHPLYERWKDMRRRCLKPNNKSYRHYGGRGIKICKRWRDFDLFVDDMGFPPPGCSLDRKNNDGDYKPSNCRWATPAQQSRNTRRTIWKKADGLTLCTVDRERRLGLSPGAVWHRIKNGWSVRKALTTKKATIP